MRPLLKTNITIQRKYFRICLTGNQRQRDIRLSLGDIRPAVKLCKGAYYLNGNVKKLPGRDAVGTDYFFERNATEILQHQAVSVFL